MAPDTHSSKDTTADAALGLRAGAVATAVMTAFRTPVAQSPPPTAAFLARYLGGAPDEYVGRGLVLHLAYGAVAGAVFGAIAGRWIRGAEAVRERRGAVLGVGYGVGLSAFGARVVLDRVVGMDLAPDERFVFHASHVVYGLTLGVWFGSSA